MTDDNKPTVHFEGRDIAASKWLQLISDRQGTTPTTYTMFDPMTGQVFGRGLTQEQVRQCVIDNVLVRTPEEEDDDAPAEGEEDEAADAGDERHTTRTRAETWARRAVEVGKLRAQPVRRASTPSGW